MSLTKRRWNFITLNQQFSKICMLKVLIRCLLKNNPIPRCYLWRCWLRRSQVGSSNLHFKLEPLLVPLSEICIPSFEKHCYKVMGNIHKSIHPSIFSKPAIKLLTSRLAGYHSWWHSKGVVCFYSTDSLWDLWHLLSLASINLVVNSTTNKTLIRSLWRDKINRHWHWPQGA